MEYTDFYDLATYGNENWRGKFTPREVAINAYDYLSEYNASKEQGHLTFTMIALYELLKVDRKNGNDDEDLNYWIEQIEAIG